MNRINISNDERERINSLTLLKKIEDKIGKSDEWEYISEGAKHIVFSLHSSNIIVRIPKSLSSIASYSISTIKIIQKAIGLQYVDFPINKVHLSCEFINSLYWQCHEKIPTSRKSSWERLLSHTTSTSSTVIPAFILKDYRYFPKSSGNDLTSIELKPKAGYVVTSPLIKPEHRHVKFYQTRHFIIQRLLEQNIIQRGWCTSAAKEISRLYNPLDLYSMDKERMRNCIKGLLENPKNNFKLWNISNNLSMHNVQEILLEILIQEPILNNLQFAQRNHDILDVEGVILVYHRLITLLENDLDAVHTLCNDFAQLDRSAVPDCISLHKLTTQMKHFQDKIPDNFFTRHEVTAWMKEHKHTFNETYMSCSNLITQLDTPSCVYLIQHWLLSLTLCDVSIFVTFQPSHSFEAKLQRESSHGVVVLSNSRAWEYFVKVVDFDLKPSSKLRDREEKESLLRCMNHDTIE